MYIEIDRNNRLSYKKQLYDIFTSKILKGEYRKGEKLPSSRVLADQLNISRNTVTEIYDQLIAEAYLEARKGKGTYVSDLETVSVLPKIKDSLVLSEEMDVVDAISFVPGTPDLDAFPKKVWMDAERKYLFDHGGELLGYQDSFGYIPLRKAIADYLYKHKGIQCSYEQVMMTSGTKGALELIALLFHKERRAALLESPGIGFAPDIFGVFDYRLYPLQVDDKGILVESFPQVTNGLLYATPSHQFPLGGVLPIDRRQKLIDYAREHCHYIIEDDYDCEFRYNGAPVNSLYQLSGSRVIHIGTFSKTLAPALQLGYMVLPFQLMEAFRILRSSLYQYPNQMVQCNVYDMFASGTYEKHIYKTCKRYKRKIKLLSETISNTFGDTAIIYGANVGMHICIRYPNMMFDEHAKEIFKFHGVDVEYTTEYQWENSGASDTLVIGFGHLSEQQITEGIKRLEKAIQQIRSAQITVREA